MKRLKSGLYKAVSSVLIGLALTASVGFCTRQGWIPSYSPLILSIVNILASIFTLNKMRRWGIFYTFGWLAGSFIFFSLGLMDTTDLVFNLVAPVLLLVLRLILWLTAPLRRAKPSQRARAKQKA